MNIRTVVSIVFAVAALSVFAVAEISNLEVTPGSGGKVTVSYSLSEDAVVTPRFYAGGDKRNNKRHGSRYKQPIPFLLWTKGNPTLPRNNDNYR